MRYCRHSLRNAMKEAMESCHTHSVLFKVGEQLRFLNRIVKYFKRHGWNTALPEGYHVIEDVQTSFETTEATCSLQIECSLLKILKSDQVTEKNKLRTFVQLNLESILGITKNEGVTEKCLHHQQESNMV